MYRGRRGHTGGGDNATKRFAGLLDPFDSAFYSFGDTLRLKNVALEESGRRTERLCKFLAALFIHVEDGSMPTCSAYLLDTGLTETGCAIATRCGQ